MKDFAIVRTHVHQSTDDNDRETQLYGDGQISLEWDDNSFIEGQVIKCRDIYV